MYGNFNDLKPKKTSKFRFPGYVMGVKVPPSDTHEGKKAMLEAALKQLKKMVKEAKIVDELKARQCYDKPSVKKREIKKTALRRNYYDVVKQKAADKKGI